MTTATLPAATTTPTGDDLTHFPCCVDDLRAMCGADLTTAPIVDDPADCVVCVDLDNQPTIICPTGWRCDLVTKAACPSA